MTIYRLVRYFLILFAAACVFLFIFRASFSPFPAVSQAFENLEAYYSSLDNVQNINGNAENSQDILQSEAERLISPEKNTLEKFLADEQTKSSLLALDRGIHSLENIVRAYFVEDDAFRDLIITRQGAVLYRYENTPINEEFGLAQDVSTEAGVLTVQVIYSPQRFLARFSQSEYPIALKWNNTVSYTPNFKIQRIGNMIHRAETDLLPEGFETMQRNDKEILYSYKPFTPYNKSPVFYYLETLPSPRRISRQALFIAFCLIGVLFLFALDKTIINFFKNRNHKTIRRSLFPTFTPEPERDDNMEWLDKIAAKDFPKQISKPGESKQPMPNIQEDPIIGKDAILGSTEESRNED